MPQDALLANQSAASLRATIAPKWVAGRNLQHRLAATAPGGSVQLFSSIASLLGSAGQASYAAANALLDAAAEGWQRQGICAASIAWGAWGGVGMAATDPTVEARLRRVGVAAIQPGPGLAALQKAVALSVGSAAGTIMAAGLLWERLLVEGRQQKHFYGEFAPLTTAAAAAVARPAVSSPDATATVSVVARSGKARRRQRKHDPEVQQPLAPVAAPAAASDLPAWRFMPLAERAAYFADEVSALVARAAGKAVGPEEPLLSAGLDSLGELGGSVPQTCMHQLAPPLALALPRAHPTSPCPAARARRRRRGGGAAGGVAAHRPRPARHPHL